MNNQKQYPAWAIKVIANKNNINSQVLLWEIIHQTPMATGVFVPQLNALMEAVRSWLHEAQIGGTIQDIGSPT